MATSLNISLESPGILIREVDRSATVNPAVGTNIYLAGFTPQGPTDEPINLISFTEFEEVFGLPTTPAERYSYNAVKQLFTSNASIIFTRMPYGSGAGYGYSETYNALVFPLVGVSAVEVNPCDYYRQVDEDNCRVNFPWLYNTYFVTSSVCYGTSNLECPLNSSDEDSGYLYIINDPVDYNSVFTGFKFVVDADTSPEDLRIFQLRPTVDGYNTTYTVVTSINLSAVVVNDDENQSYLSNDGRRLIVDLRNSVYASQITVNSGFLSGQVLSGIPVSAGDVFATYSVLGAPVLKYFNASPEVANTYKTVLSSLPSLSGGTTFTLVTTALDTTNLDFLIEFCTTPIDSGLSCQTITALGLQVPEEDKYTFHPLAGDAQLNDANFYVLGEPISKSLNASEYQLLVNDQFNWKCGVFSNAEAALDVVNNDVRAGMIVINKLKAAQMEDFTGYYLAVNDNLNVNPATDFDNLTGINGYYSQVCNGVSGEWVNVPDERWNFDVSAIFNGNAGSISEIVEQNAGVDFGKPFYNDSLIVSLFKLRPTRFTQTINKLDQILVEKYIGSMNANRKILDENGGPARSFYVQDTVNNGSNYLEVKVNPYLSTNNCWSDDAGNPRKTVRMFRERTAEVFGNFNAEATLANFADNLYGIGDFVGYCQDQVYDLCVKKDIGNLPAKLERALRNVENPLDQPIDITVDAGLSTIWATRQAVIGDSCITDPSICYNYDDSYFVNTDSLSPYDGTSLQSNIGDAWEVIYNVFNNFAEFTRKAAGGVGHLHIQDPLRQIFVNGRDYKVVNRQKQYLIDPATNQPTEKYATFARNIWAYLRNLYSGVNSSYSMSYANWIKDYDVNTDAYCWYGPSAHVAALLARNDRAQYPWTAPLGVSNGNISANVLDIAFNPNQRERDLISRIGLNPIAKFPEGYLLWNTLTLQKQASALRENYIRRGLLWLANSAQNTLRPFIGQPNTIVTRTRVKNSLKPLLDFMKDNSGVYAYEIVCDERNNRPANIDNYELKVAIYVQPVKTIKFILVDVIITPTGVSFSDFM